MVKRSWLAWSGVVLCWAGPASAEDITVSTYYPSPRGVYQELRVANNAFLATQPGGEVRIGLGAPAGTTLSVAGGARLTGNLRVEGTIRIDGGGPQANRVLVSSDANGNATWGFATYAP